MILPSLLIAASFVVLVAGAQLLVKGASSLAARMGISSFFIGLTIVGFGTSAPELVTSVVASARGSGGLAVGNVIGSNVFNVAVVLGVSALIRPIAVELRTVRREVWVAAAVSALPLAALLDGGRLGRLAGGVGLLLLVAYVWKGLREGRTERASAAAADVARATLGAPPPRAVWIDVVTVLGGVAILAGGSTLLVGSASDVARSLGLSEFVIGVTIVGAGTSAPELVTSVVAALKGESDVAVGNVLGSNVFNVLGVLGAACLVSPQVLSPETLAFDLPVMLAAGIALWPVVVTQSRVSRLEGALLLGGYVVYVAFVISRGA